MKKAILILVFAVSTAMVFNACSGNSSKKTEQSTKVEYTCPMHDDVVQEKPGQCPKCGMDLVEKKTEAVQDSTKM
jgi:membrane fusion protein, copper/silver efflux system